MTVFDRLEAQLVDAHARRNRRSLPRPAPRHVVAFAAAAAAAVAIVVAGLAGGWGSDTAVPRPGNAVAPVVRSHTTVAVLNAAGQPGRARNVAYALAQRGWKIVRVTNHAGAPLAASSVRFAPGRSEAASMIAAELGIHDVAAANAAVTTAAWPDAEVVVVIGRDAIRQPR